MLRQMKQICWSDVTLNVITISNRPYWQTRESWWYIGYDSWQYAIETRIRRGSRVVTASQLMLPQLLFESGKKN